jgi:hypothetical protein
MIHANKIAISVLTVLLTGCGGGHHSDAPNNQNQPVQKTEFGLKKLNSVAPGEVLSSRLTGTNANGIIVNGDIRITNLTEQVVNGVLVTPRVLDFKMYTGSGSGSNSLQPSEAWTLTYYIETSTGNLVSLKQTYFASTTILNCQSLSPYHMPSSIKSGDSDITPGFNCGNQMLDSGVWRATTNIANQIVLNVKTQTRDVLGAGKELEIIYPLDADGNIVSISIEGLTSYKGS